MRTISLIGAPSAGKTTTLRKIRQREGDRLELHAAGDIQLRVLHSEAAQVRVAAFSGSTAHDPYIRELVFSSDIVVCTIDTQDPESQMPFFERHPEILMAPRVWQLNKIDLGSAARTRMLLPEFGMDPRENQIYRTNALTGDGVDALIAGALTYLDKAYGPGAAVREAVTDAFPDRASRLLDAVDCRWVEKGLRGRMACTRCGQPVLVWMQRGAGAEPTGVLQEPADPPALLPRLPAPEYSRDLLLAELRRALPEALLERVERGLGRDEERRTPSCPHCTKNFEIVARLDGSRWRLDPA